MALFAQLAEVHRLAVAGGEAEIARTTGDLIGRRWLAISRFADVARLAQATLTLGDDAGAFYDLGWARRATGFPREALTAYAVALRLYRDAGDRGNEAVTLNNIGAVHRGLGQPEQALAHYHQALPIQREVGDRACEAITLTNIGAGHRGLCHPEQAVAHYHQALPIRREVGDRAGEAVTRYNIAMVHRARRNWGLATAELEQVVELERQVKNPDLASDIAMLEQVRREAAQAQESLSEENTEGLDRSLGVVLGKLSGKPGSFKSSRRWWNRFLGRGKNP